MFIQLINQLSKQLVKTWQQQVTSRLSPLLSTLWIGGLAVAGLALWVFTAIAEEVLEQETEVFDTAILQTIANWHTPLLNQIMIGITFLGEPVVLTALSILCGIILLRQRQWPIVITLAAGAAGALGLNFWLKALFARTRPALWERIVDVNYYSFPSGHAMISLVIYGLIGYWLAVRFRPQQIVIIGITALLIATIGFSRLYLGVHWPTDVIAGYAAGLVWLVICILSQEVVSKLSSSQIDN